MDAALAPTYKRLKRAGDIIAEAVNSKAELVILPGGKRKPDKPQPESLLPMEAYISSDFCFAFSDASDLQERQKGLLKKAAEYFLNFSNK